MKDTRLKKMARVSGYPETVVENVLKMLTKVNKPGLTLNSIVSVIINYAAQSIWTTDSSVNCCHQVGSTQWYRTSLYVVASQFPFTRTKGPSLVLHNNASVHKASSI